MDPGGLGAVIGLSVIAFIGVGVCVYDKFFKKTDELTSSTPLKKISNSV